MGVRCIQDCVICYEDMPTKNDRKRIINRDQTATFPHPPRDVASLCTSSKPSNELVKAQGSVYSCILARISESLKRWYSYIIPVSQQRVAINEEVKLTSSPTLIGLPPQPGSKTRSPALTDVGTSLPSLSRAPGPTAMTVASGRGLFVADVGKKMPVAVFYS